MKQPPTQQMFPVCFFFLICLLLPAPGRAIDNAECLECHSDDTLTKESTDNILQLPITESLYVDEEKFERSPHGQNEIACVDCHSDIEELNWDEEVPHALTLKKVYCVDCHEDTAEEYKDSVHMQIHKKGITMNCYACHGYHYVQDMENASVTERTNTFCLKCHNPTIKHDWLPAGDSHFESVECVVCHAPDTPRSIILRFYDLVTNQFYEGDVLLAKIGINSRDFLTAFDKNHNDFIEAGEFENLMFLLKRKNIRAILRAELVADVDALAHQIHQKSAQRDCAQCHAADSPYFSKVSILMSNDDGTVNRYNIDRSVLESYYVSHFYLLGGTRVKLLDKIGLLILAGGIFGAFAHFCGRVVTTRRRK